MVAAVRSLRVRLAVLGFAAIYLPVLVLFVVVVATTEEEVNSGGQRTETSSFQFTALNWTILGLAPVAAGLAWWWAGRAVRPIDRVRSVAEEIEGTDLSRRIQLRRGPREIVALAASFDAMLDRLEHAATEQRHLIEEASHELRIPLSILMTNAEVLLAHPHATPQEHREGLERSLRATARLEATLTELLVRARERARTLDRRPTDLTALLSGVVADAEVLASPRGIRLLLTAPPSVACPVDEATVRRAVLNLVDNAIRYSPTASDVHIDLEVSAAEVDIVVTDHGPGIPPANQRRIFERFWRGNDDVPGTGLGLPIAHQVAVAHGGALTVASPGPAGDGSRFRFSLPLG